MCLYPRLIKNKKYTRNQKNGGIIPPVNDSRVLYVPIGCGECIECKKQKKNEWQTRLMDDIKINKNAKFITLTFSNEKYTELNKEINQNAKPYEIDNQLATLATRRFLERWRKEYKRSLRHWLVTELGQQNTENIHLHGLIWTEKEEKIINKIWKYGYTFIGQYVNEITINYIVKYINKIDALHKTYRSIILTSPGIGNNYINTTNSTKNKYKEKQTQETYITKTGTKISLPVYWRNKIYTDEEREKLWIEKLNKKQRYVLGQKIDISKDQKQYVAALKIAQAKNIRLGYGTGKKNWIKQHYEEQRRKILQEERKMK